MTTQLFSAVEFRNETDGKYPKLKKTGALLLIEAVSAKAAAKQVLEMVGLGWKLGATQETVIHVSLNICWSVVPAKALGHLTLFNLDDVQAPLSQYNEDYLLRLLREGRHLELLRGEVGASELGMHCGIVACVGIVAAVNETRTYAYVVHYNPKTGEVKVTDGCYHRFDNGRFSISYETDHERPTS